MPDLFGADPTPQSMIGPQPAPKRDNSALLRLAALLPIAMAKGGREAVTGLLTGYQQEQARRQQVGQQQGLQQHALTRQQGLDQQMAEDRKLQQQHELQQRQMQFLKMAQDAGADAQTPEEAFANMQRYTTLAPQYGLSQAAVEPFAAVPPSRTERRAAEKALGDLRRNYGDQAPTMSATLPTGEVVPYAELERRVGFQRDPMAPMSAKPETRGLDVQAA